MIAWWDEGREEENRPEMKGLLVSIFLFALDSGVQKPPGGSIYADGGDTNVSSVENRSIAITQGPIQTRW